MPDQLQDALVKRAMARDAQQTIGPMDPRTHDVYPERDDPFSTPDFLHKIMDQVADPTNWSGPEVAAAAPVVGEGKNLIRFMIDFYKGRIKAEPWLAGHPGLTQVPEFRAAFEELNPTKRILGVGEDVKASTTAKLKRGPAVPVATGPMEAPAVASIAPAGAKPPKTALSGKWNSLGDTKQHNSILHPEGVKMIRAEAAAGSTAEQLAAKFQLHPTTIKNILSGQSWNFVK